jgi:Protein kinase domain/Family of unknown function (DUF6318)
MVQRGGEAADAPASDTVAPVGAVAERYEIRGLIGRGPNGSVWRAVRRGSVQEVAVKLLHERYARDPEVRDRLSREYPVLTAFLHPAQIRLRELILGDEVGLAGELVAGSDLRQLGTFTPEEAARVVADAAEALAAAHAQGVVHCGIKPTNLLLGKDSGQLRITDTRVGRLVQGFRGRPRDPRYTAPEVVRGGPPVAASDVYALGQVLCGMLTGAPVVDRGVAPRLPRPAGALEDVMYACLAADPAARPVAAEVARQLRDAVAASVAAALPEPVPARAAPAVHDAPPVVAAPAADRPAHRYPLRWLVLGAVLLGTGAAVLVPNLTTISTGSGSASAAATVSPPATLSRPAPGPTLPPAPILATAQDAAAFARYWFDALNYAVATGDTAPVIAAASPGCQACTAAVDAIRDGYRDGGWLRGGRYTVRQALVDGFFDPNRTVVVGTVFDRSPLWTVNADGTVRSQLPGTTFTSCQVLLARADDRWQVIGQQCGHPDG